MTTKDMLQSILNRQAALQSHLDHIAQELETQRGMITNLDRNLLSQWRGFEGHAEAIHKILGAMNK